MGKKGARTIKDLRKADTVADLSGDRKEEEGAGQEYLLRFVE
jgi:hypothetical protein